MISRTEAKQMLFEFMSSEWTMKNYNFEGTIDEIYDSIGSCGECKHLSVEKHLDGALSKTWCIKKGIMFKCFNDKTQLTCIDDFERKEDD